MRGNRVLASDGVAGVLHDVFFDTSAWKIHFLAVDRGAGITIDRLLVPAARATLKADGTISVAMTRGRFGPRPGARSAAWLCSGRETARYAIQANDGPAGQLDDLIVAPDWSVPSIAITTASWLFPGPSVRLDVGHIARVDRAQRAIAVTLSLAEILRLPGVGPGSI